MMGVFEKAAESNPDDPDAWDGLGSCYVDLDRAEDAINAYVQAIRVNPRMAPAHCNLGMTYREW